MADHPVLIAGEWRKAQSRRSFSSENPALGEKLLIDGEWHRGPVPGA